MQQFLNQLIVAYPDIKIQKGDNFYWSPKTKIVFYKEEVDKIKLAKWTLLHEVGHAILNHKNYKTDFSLIRMESEAWETAKKISPRFNIEIPEKHIQDCLDSYRDWIYRRSICPKCNTKSFQTDKALYRCFNCHLIWKVTTSRFCRIYRISKRLEQLNTI